MPQINEYSWFQIVVFLLIFILLLKIKMTFYSILSINSLKLMKLNYFKII